MKKCLLGLFLCLNAMCTAQEYVSGKNIFIRVYGYEGKKIMKGHFLSVDNDDLKLMTSDSILGIPISSISKIRTRRSFAGNALIGSMVGVTIGFSLIAGDPETSTSSVYTGEERVVAVLGGLLFGGIIGAGTAVFKRSKAYRLSKDPFFIDTFVNDLKEQIDYDMIVPAPNN